MSNYELKEMKYEDYWELRALFSLRYAQTCENIITNSYIWKDYYKARYVTDGKGLFWIYRLQDEYFTASPVCADKDVKKYFEMAQDYFHTERKCKLVMYTVDEKLIRQLELPQDRYTVEEDRRYFDYVYDADALRRLAGKKYHKKKNHVNAFYKEYEGRYEFKFLSKKDEPEILAFLEDWKKHKSDTEEHEFIDSEAVGIKYILEHEEVFDYKIGAVYVDNKLEAFTIGNYESKEDMVYIPVEKANPEIRGLYPYICSQFLIEAFPEAGKENREDDMGLEGLRKSKLSYNPIYMVEK